jgi:hypothetical protein
MVNNNIAITKGNTFNQQYIVGPNPDGTAVDLTGYSVAGRIRKNATSNVVIGTFHVTITDVTHGHLSLDLSSTETGLLPIGYYVYDLVFASGSYVVTYITGNCNVLLGETVQIPPESGTVFAQNPVIYVGIPGPQGIPGPKGDSGAVNGISDVPGLVTALAGKAALVHYHVINDITDFESTVIAGGTF